MNSNDIAARANHVRNEIKALAALIAREADNEVAAPSWSTLATLQHVRNELLEAARSVHPKARDMMSEENARTMVLTEALATR